MSSIGSTSMKRNICTLTDSSCMAQAMIRSSHQSRFKNVVRRVSRCSNSHRPISCVDRSIAARSAELKSEVMMDSGTLSLLRDSAGKLFRKQ